MEQNSTRLLNAERGTFQDMDPATAAEELYGLIQREAQVVAGGVILRLDSFNVRPDVAVNGFIAEGLAHRLVNEVNAFQNTTPNAIAFLATETSGAYLTYALTIAMLSRGWHGQIDRIRKGNQPSIVYGNDPIHTVEVHPITHIDGNSSQYLHALIPPDEERNRIRVAVVADDVVAFGETMRGGASIAQFLYPNLAELFLVDVFSKDHQTTDGFPGERLSLLPIESFGWNDIENRAEIHAVGFPPGVLQRVKVEDFSI